MSIYLQSQGNRANKIERRYRFNPRTAASDPEFGTEFRCHKGGSKVKYVQSPEERELLARLIPVFDYIFPGGVPNTSLFDVPSLDINLPSMPTVQQISAPSQVTAPTTTLPTYSAATPDIKEYIPAGEEYQAVYRQISPAFWDVYNRDVENKIAAKYAGSGRLGSGMGGLSGAAADALAEARMRAGNQIAAQAYQAAQAPLMRGYEGAMRAALQQAATEYGGGLQQMALDANNAMRAALANQQMDLMAQRYNQQTGLSQALAQYGAGVNAAMQSALLPWQAELAQATYPYQILPGVLGGTMPQPVVTSGGKK